jgi:fatty-acyl-CoA synthase
MDLVPQLELYSSPSRFERAHGYRHPKSQMGLQSPGAIAAIPADVWSALAAAAARRGAARALTLPESSWSYSNLVERGRTVAAALQAAGIRRGDRFAVLMDDCPELIDLLIGALLHGSVPCLLNTRAEAPVLSDRLEGLRLRGFFVSNSEQDRYLRTVLNSFECDADGEVPRRIEERRAIWIVGGAVQGWPSYADFLAAVPTPLPDDSSYGHAKPDDEAMIVFSSGWSGVPKSCPLSHLAILSKLPGFARHFGLNSDARVWVPMPMYQSAFISMLLCCLSIGAEVVTTTGLDPLGAAQVIQEKAVTHAYPVYPVHWLPIVDHVQFLPSNFLDLAYVCLLGSIGLLGRMQRAVPQAVLVNTYGTNDTGGGVCMPDIDDVAARRLGGHGRPFPGYAIRIVEPETAAAMAHGEPGEIEISGPGITDPSTSVPFPPAFTKDGWLKTGDLGSIDARGNLIYLGRLSELLVIAGRRCLPETIEAVLSSHPRVALAMVAGTPDPVLGQVVRAFVELRPDANLDAVELVDYCRERLQEELLPRYIHFVTEWPTSASKILKPELSALALSERLIA